MNSKREFGEEGVLKGATYKAEVTGGLFKLVRDGVTKTPCGRLYMTFNFDDDHKLVRMEFKMGHQGICGNLELIARLATMGIRKGLTWKDIARTAKGINCRDADNVDSHFSCPHAVAMALEKEYGEEVE